MYDTIDYIRRSVGRIRFLHRPIQRYQRLMYSVAKRYAASENEAEDIMQDAVERLLKRIPKLMELPGCTLPTYLVYTVRSTAVNFKRHQNVIE